MVYPLTTDRNVGCLGNRPRPLSGLIARWAGAPICYRARCFENTVCELDQGPELLRALLSKPVLLGGVVALLGPRLLRPP
jgi:hypothetical protein